MQWKLQYYTSSDYTTQYYFDSLFRALAKRRWVKREVPDLEQVTLGVTTGA